MTTAPTPTTTTTTTAPTAPTTNPTHTQETPMPTTTIPTSPVAGTTAIRTREGLTIRFPDGTAVSRSGAIADRAHTVLVALGADGLWTVHGLRGGTNQPETEAKRLSDAGTHGRVWAIGIADMTVADRITQVRPGVDRETAPLGPPCKVATSDPAPTVDPIPTPAPLVTLDPTAPTQVALALGVDNYHLGVKASQALWVYALLVGVRDGVLRTTDKGQWAKGTIPVLVNMIEAHMDQSGVRPDDRPGHPEGYLSKATKAVREATPGALDAPQGDDDTLWANAMAWVELFGNPVTYGLRKADPKADTLEKIVANAVTRVGALELTVADLVLALVAGMDPADRQALAGALA